MSYGFQSFTANGSIQFDSTKSGYSGLVVAGSGTGTVTSSIFQYPHQPIEYHPNPVIVSGVKSGDLLFAKIDSLFAGQGVRIFRGEIDQISSDTYSMEIITYNDDAADDGNDPYGDTVSWIVARKSSDFTPPSTPDEYGMEILSSDGTIQYDTRQLTGQGAFQITDIIPKGALSGDGLKPTGSGYSTTAEVWQPDTGYVTNETTTSVTDTRNFDIYVLLNSTAAGFPMGGYLRGPGMSDFFNFILPLQSFKYFYKYRRTAQTAYTVVQYVSGIRTTSNEPGVPEEDFFPMPNKTALIAGVRIT